MRIKTTIKIRSVGFYAALAITMGSMAFQGYAEEAIKVGDVVYEQSFNKSVLDWANIQNHSWARFIPNGRGGECVEITAEGQGGAGAIGNRDVLGNVDKSKSSTFLITASLGKKLEKLKGYELNVEVGVKGENIPVPTKSWEGVRMGVNYVTSVDPYGQGYYNLISGSFDWKNVSYLIRIPSDMKDMSMSLGLISASGKVCFDHVKITVADIPLTMMTPPPGPVYKGHTLPRLRGFVTGIADPGSEAGKKFLDTIAEEWKANVAKLWFHLQGDPKEVDAKLDTWMNSVDGALDTAKKDSLYLILHFASRWHVKEHGGNDLFYEKPEYAAKFVESWQTVAKRFKGRKEIYAFELLNESPLRMPVTEGCPDYPELMERAAKAINEIDPDRSIIVQTEEWWGPRAFYKMRPINAKNIIYAVHFYSPFPVSHQGVGEFNSGKTSWVANAYPGTIDGVKWDKETLKRELQPVREFQKAYNAQIIVSEFGCVRWALGDSRQKLLKDMIDIYEEYGWDWLFHAYPEWQGWSPEFGNDPWNGKRPEPPTATETLLKSWFSKNQYPAPEKVEKHQGPATSKD